MNVPMPDLSDPLRAVSLTVLTGWFLLTLVRQIDHRWIEKVFVRADPFELIPAWRLFDRAPSDCRLWYRDRDRDGNTGPWHSATHRCGPSMVVWSPGFRPVAYLNILVLGLVRRLAKRPDWCAWVAPWGQTSAFYAPIENHVRHLPAEPGAVVRQFAIALGDDHPGADASGAYYLSPFFELPQAGSPPSGAGSRR